MRCPACAADNQPTSKFCGVCGTRLAPGPPTVPPVVPAAAGEPAVSGSAATSVMASAPRGRAPDPPADSGAGSLAGSLRLPEAPGARMARIAIVAAIDVGLVIGGVVLATRKPAPVTAAQVEVGSGSGSGSGSLVGPARDAGPARVPPGPGPGPGPGPVIPIGPIGPIGPGARDAGAASGDAGARGLDASSAAAVDAGAVAIATDAAPVIEPPPVDAAPPPPPEIDAAPVIDPGPPVDAAEAPAIDAPEAAVSAAEIVRQANHLAVASVGRLDRCYQSATKVLPADQPLRGQVDIGLAVLPTGAVTSVVVLQNTTGSDQLGTCVVGIVASWEFSPHDAGEPVHVSRTFSF